MTGPPRPTIRCLTEDLAGTVTDKGQRSVLLSGDLPDLSLPLHEVAHPIISAARARFAGQTPPDRDELLRDVSDRLWAKCRHGERWRGIVLWHISACIHRWPEAGPRRGAVRVAVV